MSGSPSACLFMPPFLSIVLLRPAGVSTEDILEVMWTRGYGSGHPSKINDSWNESLHTPGQERLSVLGAGARTPPFPRCTLLFTQ